MASAINMLSARVQDIEIEDNFNPITGLEKVPIVSLEEAINAATADREFSEHDFSNNVHHALRFARQLKKKAGDAEVLNVEEIAAVQVYTQQTDLFKIINTRLRNPWPRIAEAIFQVHQIVSQRYLQASPDCTGGVSRSK